MRPVFLCLLMNFQTLDSLIRNNEIYKLNPLCLYGSYAWKHFALDCLKQCTTTSGDI